MTVDLLHLSQPLDRGISKRGTKLVAAHYIGYSADLVARMIDHAEGRGARLLQVCLERGIDWSLVRTWDGKDRLFERALKNQKHAARFCPLCTTPPLLFPRNAGEG